MSEKEKLEAYEKTLAKIIGLVKGSLNEDKNALAEYKPLESECPLIMNFLEFYYLMVTQPNSPYLNKNFAIQDQYKPLAKAIGLKELSENIKEVFNGLNSVFNRYARKQLVAKNEPISAVKMTEKIKEAYSQKIRSDIWCYPVQVEDDEIVAPVAQPTVVAQPTIVAQPTVVQPVAKPTEVAVKPPAKKRKGQSVSGETPPAQRPKAVQEPVVVSPPTVIPPTTQPLVAVPASILAAPAKSYRYDTDRYQQLLERAINLRGPFRTVNVTPDELIEGILNSLSDQNEVANSLQATVNVKSSEVQTLKASLAQAKINLTNCQQELEQAKQANVDLATELQRCNEQNKDLKKDNKQLQEQVVDLNQAIKQLKAQHAKDLTVAKSNTALIVKERDALAIKLDAATVNVTNLNAKIQKFLTESQDVDKQAKAKIVELESLNQQLETSNKDLQRLNKQDKELAVALQADIATLQEQVRSSSQDLVQLREYKNVCDANLRTAQSALDSCNDSLIKQKEQEVIHQQMMSRKTEEMKELEERLKQRSAELEAQVTKALDTVKDKVGAETVAEVAEMQDEIDDAFDQVMEELQQIDEPAAMACFTKRDFKDKSDFDCGPNGICNITSLNEEGQCVPYSSLPSTDVHKLTLLNKDTVNVGISISMVDAVKERVRKLQQEQEKRKADEQKRKAEKEAAQKQAQATAEVTRAKQAVVPSGIIGLLDKTFFSAPETLQDKRSKILSTYCYSLLQNKLRADAKTK